MTWPVWMIRELPYYGFDQAGWLWEKSMDFGQAHEEENWDKTKRWSKIWSKALWAHFIFMNDVRCGNPCYQVDEEQQVWQKVTKLRKFLWSDQSDVW